MDDSLIELLTFHHKKFMVRSPVKQDEPIFSLPLEIMFEILFILPHQDVRNLGLTCCYLYNICRNDDLWRKIMIREYLEISPWSSWFMTHTYISKRSLKTRIHDLENVMGRQLDEFDAIERMWLRIYEPAIFYIYDPDQSLSHITTLIRIGQECKTGVVFHLGLIYDSKKKYVNEPTEEGHIRVYDPRARSFRDSTHGEFTMLKLRVISRQ